MLALLFMVALLLMGASTSSTPLPRAHHAPRAQPLRHLYPVLTAPLMLTLFATALHVLRMLSELVLLPTLIMPLKPIVAITPNI